MHTVRPHAGGGHEPDGPFDPDSGAALPVPASNLTQLRPVVRDVTIAVDELHVLHIAGDHEDRVLAIGDEDGRTAIRLVGSDYSLGRFADMITATTERAAA